MEGFAIIVYRRWRRIKEFLGREDSHYKNKGSRADIILIIIIILSQKNICDSEIVLFSFFFNHDRFVLYVLGKYSEFLDIKEDLCGKQRGVSTSFIPFTSRFGLIILIYYNIDLDQVLFSQNYSSNPCMLITLAAGLLNSNFIQLKLQRCYNVILKV